MLLWGIGYIASCWVGSTKSSGRRNAFIMTWSGLMMCCTLCEMMFWRMFKAESNLWVGITLSMMGFMSMQAVLTAATYANTASNSGFDEAITAFAVLYAAQTFLHIGLMAMWRDDVVTENYANVRDEFDGKSLNKEEYEDVGSST